jgi:tol-pal system protein YbgF
MGKRAMISHHSRRNSPMNPVTLMFRFISISCFALALYGCGTVPESTSDTWESNPPVSTTARLEYRVDSLMNENRRLQQQTEALATENRNLTARSAELETRIAEMEAAPKIEPVASTTPDVASGYEGALAAFRNRDFAGAIQEFDALLKGNVRDDLADNCHYWMGESYYGMKSYREAIDHFRMVLDYRKSEKKDDAQLMIGNASAALGDKAGARDAYNNLISSYPVSPLIPKAKEKLARLK